jgi:hypothetical protein
MQPRIDISLVSLSATDTLARPGADLAAPDSLLFMQCQAAAGAAAAAAALATAT